MTPSADSPTLIIFSPSSPTGSAEPPSSHSDNIDTNGAIALGFLVLVIFTLIGWFAHRKLRQRRERALDEEHDAAQRMGDMRQAISMSPRVKFNSVSEGSWSGCRMGEGLPAYSPPSSRMGTLGGFRGGARIREDKRWWGSVAKTGDTRVAERMVSVGSEADGGQGRKNTVRSSHRSYEWARHAQENEIRPCLYCGVSKFGKVEWGTRHERSASVGPKGETRQEGSVERRDIRHAKVTTGRADRMGWTGYLQGKGIENGKGSWKPQLERQVHERRRHSEG